MGGSSCFICDSALFLGTVLDYSTFIKFESDVL